MQGNKYFTKTYHLLLFDRLREDLINENKKFNNCSPNRGILPFFYIPLRSDAGSLFRKGKCKSQNLIFQTILLKCYFA